jgi:hypothetical protein
MTVHIGEINSQVTPAAPGQSAGSDRGATPGVDLEERIRELRLRTEWLATRVAAEEFED